MDWSSGEKIVLGIIGAVVALGVAAKGIPYLLNATTEISLVDGLPFADFFAADGLVSLLVGASLLVAVIGMFYYRSTHKRK